MPYVYMLNVVTPLFFMLQEPPDRMIPGLLLLLVFLVLYRQSVWDLRRLGWCLGGELMLTFVLCYFYHPLYIYLIFIFLYPLVRLSHRGIAWFAGCFVAGLTAIVVSTGFYKELTMILVLLPPLFGGAIMPFVIKASFKYQELSEQLKLAMEDNKRLAQEGERQRIARELHDTLGHTLSLISMKGELVQKLIVRDPEHALREAADIQETARAALKQMRSLVTDMNTVRLVDEAQHAKMLCAAAGVTLNWEGLGQAPPLTPLQETILAMCLRELVTNVVKHSKASTCCVEIEHEREGVRVTVEDDGQGFDPAAPARHSGNGLRGIRERLQLIEGRLDYESSVRRGACFTIKLPIVIRQAN